MNDLRLVIPRQNHGSSVVRFEFGGELPNFDGKRGVGCGISL